jgi:fatty-acyl-CoA synthase
VDEFPVTASGKIRKYKLSEWGIELCREKGIEII